MLAHGMITGGLPKCSTLSIAPTAVHRTKLGSAAVRSGAGVPLLLPLPQCRWRRALASATTKVDASSVSETELPESSEVITTDTIRLSNLPWDLLAEDLQEHIRSLAPADAQLLDAFVTLDTSGRPSGLGFARFTTSEAASLALPVRQRSGWLRHQCILVALTSQLHDETSMS
jgi:hypothetical protein